MERATVYAPGGSDAARVDADHRVAQAREREGRRRELDAEMAAALRDYMRLGRVTLAQFSGFLGVPAAELSAVLSGAPIPAGFYDQVRRAFDRAAA